MDDGALQQRLWQGFGKLQTLLGGQASGGAVLEEPGLVASFVAAAPDSPTLNTVIVTGESLEPEVLAAFRTRF